MSSLTKKKNFLENTVMSLQDENSIQRTIRIILGFAGPYWNRKLFGKYFPAFASSFVWVSCFMKSDMLLPYPLKI
jgi:hypothetical protein